MPEGPATRVLLIEDNAGDAHLVTRLLTAARYGRFAVRTAGRLSAGITLLRAEAIDAAVLDLSLPDSSGLDTIKAFRAAAPDLPVIVLTGLDDRETGLRALREGCQDYLVKGNTDGETMARAIIHSVQRKRLEVELVQAKATLQAAYDGLEQRVVERTRELRRVAVEATLAEERERQAIARDLHDDLGQMLHVAKIKLGRLARPTTNAGRDAVMADLNEVVAEASRMVRSLTSQLSPPMLHELGLGPALSWLAEEMGRSHGLMVAVEASGAMPPLPQAHSAILFRATRELLINVSKHAATDAARVMVSAPDQTLILSVVDRGAGMIDWQHAMAAATGFGLASVRERITFLGGAMDIRTAPGQGTTVTLALPVERCPSAEDTP